MSLEKVPGLLSDGSVTSFFNQLKGLSETSAMDLAIYGYQDALHSNVPGTSAADAVPARMSGYQNAMHPNGVEIPVGADAGDAAFSDGAATAAVVNGVGYSPDREGQEIHSPDPQGQQTRNGEKATGVSRSQENLWDVGVATPGLDAHADWFKILETPAFQLPFDFSSESRSQIPSTPATALDSAERTKTAEQMQREEKTRMRKRNWARMKRQNEQLEQVRLESGIQQLERENKKLRTEIAGLEARLDVYRSFVPDLSFCGCQR